MAPGVGACVRATQHAGTPCSARLAARRPVSNSGALRIRRTSVCVRAQSRARRDVEPKKLAVFVSGGGTNFRAIHEACLSGFIEGEVSVVVSDRTQCAAVDYAMLMSIPVYVYPVPPAVMKDEAANLGNLSHEDLLPTSLELITCLKDLYNVEYILLAGYMKLVPPSVVQMFDRRILNIHPSLLPAFGGKGMYGQKVHEAVIKSGTRFTGCTVHFVDEGFDTGPILAQAAVPCFPNDTPEGLAVRVLRREHELYPEAVAALCDGRIEWRPDGVPYMWTVL